MAIKDNKKKVADIAKNTIFVLLILTIILSAISTWVVLDALNNVKSGVLSLPKTKQSVTQGEINLEIGNPNGGQTIGGAEVTVNIIK